MVWMRHLFKQIFETSRIHIVRHKKKCVDGKAVLCDCRLTFFPSTFDAGIRVKYDNNSPAFVTMVIENCFQPRQFRNPALNAFHMHVCKIDVPQQTAQKSLVGWPFHGYH